MSRIRTGLGLAALVSVTTAVGLSAPAHAAAKPAAYVLYKTYGWPDACSSAGYAGEQAGQWVSYYCTTVYPASWDAPGVYDLYVDY